MMKRVLQYGLVVVASGALLAGCVTPMGSLAQCVKPEAPFDQVIRTTATGPDGNSTVIEQPAVVCK
jgi:hypothetical protein